MPFSTSYANDILNYTFAKTTALNAPASVYIGLSTNDPEADGGAFMELSGNAYARVLISQRGSAYPGLINTANARSISNGAQINWNKASSDWPRVKGFGLFSSASGGSPFFYGKLELTEEEESAGGILCEAGAVMLFDPNSLKISFPTTDVDEAAATVSEE